MSEYEVVGGNPKANKKVGKAFNLEYINTAIHISHRQIEKGILQRKCIGYFGSC